MSYIAIRGARENNLKNIDVDVPRSKFVVLTGLSGSGKSSLAFDTIYAEGQRRYVESLSSYARQFLEQRGRPDVDTIDGLSPAISIEQRSSGNNPRSTVGTVTEIYDHLRVLYARLGQPHCHSCNTPLKRQSVPEIVKSLSDLPALTRLAVLAPIVRDQQVDLLSLCNQLQRDGYMRVNIDGIRHDLDGVLQADRFKRSNTTDRHDVQVYIDRLALKAETQSRLAESIELALKLADGIVHICVYDPNASADETGPKHRVLTFSEQLVCHNCNLSCPPLTPKLFSFNSPQGACPRCTGLGILRVIDPHLIVPNPALSLREGAIEPWAQRNPTYHQQLLERAAAQHDFSLVCPYERLPAKIRALLMYGEPSASDQSTSTEKRRAANRRNSKGAGFEGVIPSLQRRMDEQKRRTGATSSHPTHDDDQDAFDEFERYIRDEICPDCNGTRLRREANAVLLGGLPISAFGSLTIAQALDFCRALSLEGSAQQIGVKLVTEIAERLAFLSNVGLDYLTLDRRSSTLSGGEGQRVRLATQIGSALFGVLYVLDEPSVGLHPRDADQLLRTLTQLRDQGNSVLVVEHDEATIRAADHVIDLGPGAGHEGGIVIATGTPEQICDTPESITGQFLSGRREVAISKRRRPIGERALTLRGARHNNLKNIDISIPLASLVCVTGVSGSGKSSLIMDTLLPALQLTLNRRNVTPGSHTTLQGATYLDKVVAIDQDPIGKTPRSNPATYTGVFTLIRDLYAGLPESRVRGFNAGRFSFNVKGGRCEACKGDGAIRIEMHFLPDVFVPCDLCGGSRYNEETLRIHYRGQSIADILDMCVDDALSFLQNIPKIRDRLSALSDVGLGYLALGQPANTLSGGEAQRVKLSRELAKKGTGNTLYVLDEPTTGLHFADISRLLDVLHRLVDAGNTVVIIEHNMDVIRSADFVIDLGPEGGQNGGMVVGSGTPEAIAQLSISHTGKYLKQALARKNA